MAELSIGRKKAVERKSELERPSLAQVWELSYLIRPIPQISTGLSRELKRFLDLPQKPRCCRIFSRYDRPAHACSRTPRPGASCSPSIRSHDPTRQIEHCIPASVAPNCGSTRPQTSRPRLHNQSRSIDTRTFRGTVTVPMVAAIRSRAASIGVRNSEGYGSGPRELLLLPFSVTVRS
jgi:hypothetical protein